MPSLSHLLIVEEAFGVWPISERPIPSCKRTRLEIMTPVTIDITLAIQKCRPILSRWISYVNSRWNALAMRQNWPTSATYVYTPTSRRG